MRFISGPTFTLTGTTKGSDGASSEQSERG
jgi:hypothetical protein